MVFRDFMDASCSMLIEDHLRINPLQGMDEIMEKIVPTGAKMEVIPKQADVRSQNEGSMAALNAMLSSVQGAPTKKPRRAK